MIPPENLKAYDDLVSGFAEIERKGKSMPYTSLNGNMFSYLGPDGTLALRLGQDERDTFISTHNTELDVQHGRIMKEYVRVPTRILMDASALKTAFQQSLDYAKTLKPKATKRK